MVKTQRRVYGTALRLRLPVLVALLLVLALLAGCAPRPKQGGMTPLSVPEFTLPDLSGKQVSVSEFKGKVLILDFWATWCPPCREEIPGFVDLYGRYRDKGLAMVGISLDDGPQVVKEFVGQYKINYPVLMGNEAVTRAFGGIRGIPTTFVIGKKGKVHKKYVGFQTGEVFENDIKALLED